MPFSNSKFLGNSGNSKAKPQQSTLAFNRPQKFKAHKDVDNEGEEVLLPVTGSKTEKDNDPDGDIEMNTETEPNPEGEGNLKSHTESSHKGQKGSSAPEKREENGS